MGLVICTEPLLFCNYFKSYPGHTDANFNIAILDGHKEFVAHEKFQQMLHKVSVFLEGHSFKISDSHKKDKSSNQKLQKSFSCRPGWYFGTIFWNDIMIDILGWKSIIFSFNWQTEKKPVLDQWEVCLLYQLRKIYCHNKFIPKYRNT